MNELQVQHKSVKEKGGEREGQCVGASKLGKLNLKAAPKWPGR